VPPDEWEAINRRVMEDLASRGLVHRY